MLAGLGDPVRVQFVEPLRQPETPLQYLWFRSPNLIIIKHLKIPQFTVLAYRKASNEVLQRLPLLHFTLFTGKFESSFLWIQFWHTNSKQAS